MTAKRIVHQKDVCGGAWRFDGTRIPVDVVCRNRDLGLAWLFDGYPDLTMADIEAGLRWCHRPHRRLIRWLERARARIVNEAWHRWGTE